MTHKLAADEISFEVNGRQMRRFVYLLIISLAAAYSAAIIFQSKPLASANDRSRWCTVWSLAERGTHHIDEIITRPGWDTIDKVRYEGHFYSSKPALLPTLVAGLYRCGKFCFGWDLLGKTAETTIAILLLINLLPFIASLILVAAIVERYGTTDVCRFVVLSAAAWGTLLTPFLATFNNHTIAAASVLCALYPAMRIVIDGQRSFGFFALAGFFAAFACTNELSAAPFGLAMLGLLLMTSPSDTLRGFVPAAVVPLAAFFVCTYFQTGGWKPFYLYFGTEAYNYVHEGVPSYWMHPTGVDKAADSLLAYLIHTTVGHHGVLSLSPIVVLSLLGWIGIGRWDNAKLKPFLWMGAGLTIYFFAILLLKTEHYNYGGVSCALRWSLWLVPFGLFAMIPVLDQWSRILWFRILSCVLLALSAFSAMYPMGHPWKQPWLFEVMENAGWIDYQSRPPELDRPTYTWIETLPEAAQPVEPYWIEFSASKPDGSSERFRLTASGAETIDGRTWQKIEVHSSEPPADSPGRVSTTYYLDAEAFRRGEPPSRFLYWPEDGPTGGAREAAVTFLRGIPVTRAYRPGFIRYLKTGLRTDAFECQHVASQVFDSPGKTGPRQRYRCDAWLCPELPFGILRFQQTVFEPRSNGIASRVTFTAVAASHVDSTEFEVVE